MTTHPIQVALGGALGSFARYLIGFLATRLLGHGSSAGTMIVNVLGSFAMGVFLVTLARKGGQHLVPFLKVGVLGGFITFSSFSLYALTLFERGEHCVALVYVLVSVGLSMTAIVAGVFAIRMVLA